MHGYYWSLERCGWEPCPSAPDALVTPWSAHGLGVPALPSAASAADVLRMPSRSVVAADVPDQRVPVASTPATPAPAT